MSLPKVNATKRDAPHLWGGLRYQKFVTLCAWLDLREGELLHVEKQEDLTVARRGSADAVQVRRTRAVLTLSHEDARTIIENAWARDPEIVTVYWTTSAAGQEGRLRRQYQEAGIELWGRAAGGDDKALEVVRAFLIHRAGWGAGLAEALRNDPADTLRDTLFRRLRWEVKRPNTAVLETRAKTKLRALLQAKATAPASATKLLLTQCLDRIEAVAAALDPEARCLNAIDLEETLETALNLVRNVSASGPGVNAAAPATSPSWAVNALDALRQRLEQAGFADLESARTDLAQGRIHAAIKAIDRWIDDPESEGDLRGAALRLKAEASLALSDVAAAAALAARADEIDQAHDARLSLLILAAQDPSAALEALDDAQEEMAWLKAELLIRMGEGEAARALAETLLPLQPDDAYGGRVHAMAHAAAGDVRCALGLIEPLRARCANVELTTAAAQLHYVAAQARSVQVALSDWPAPSNPGLVRESDEAQTHLRSAAELFGLAAQALDDPRQKADQEVWRLAALAGLPAAEDDRERLAGALVNGPRPHPGAVHWALNRGWTIDAADAEAKLEALEARGEADGEDLVAHAALLAFRGAEAEALRLLRQWAPRASKSERELVQSWIDRLSHAGPSVDPAAKALRQAQATGDWAPVEALAAAEGPPGGRFILLQMLAGHGRWAAVKCQEAFLLGLDTAEAVRLSAFARYNTADLAGAARLLEEKAGLFPGGVRPDDVTGIYIDGLAAAGRLKDAFALLDTWGPRQTSRAARMLEIRLRLDAGDLEGVAVRAADPGFEDLPAAFRLQVASRIAPSAPDQARAMLRTIDFNETPIALAPMAFEVAEITRLDLDRRRAITARLFSGEARDAGVVTTFTTDEILEMVRADAQSRGGDAYERGDLMLHTLAQARIGRGFLALLTEAGPGPDLYVRDASAQSAASIAGGVLRLDVSAMLTAHGLGLLDRLYARFDRVEVGQHLQLALQSIEHDLHVAQPEKLDALEGLLALIDSGRIAVDLAPATAARLGFAADGLDASCGDVVKALADAGRLTAAAVARAREILGEEAAEVAEISGEAEVLSSHAGVAALLVEAEVMEVLLEDRRLVLEPQSVAVLRAEAAALARRKAAAMSVTALRQRLVRDILQERLHLLPLASAAEDDDAGPQSPVIESVRELRAHGPAVVWVEDRALHLRRPLEGLMVVTAFDVVEHLRGGHDGLPEVDAQEALRRMREAGFRFQPMTDREVLSLLRAAPIAKNEVVETPELAACRRAVARDLLCETSLRLDMNQAAPTVETRYAMGAMRRFEQLLKVVWEARASLAKRRAWSDWLWSAFRCDRLERTPLAGPNEAGRRSIFESHLIGLFSLGLVAGRTQKDKAAAYDWAWTRIVAVELEADPSLARTVMQAFTAFWSEAFFEEDGRPVRDTPANRKARANLCSALLSNMPEPMRELLLEHRELRRFLARRLKRRLTLGDFRFDADLVLGAVVAVHRSGRSRRVMNDDEQLKILRNQDGIVIERIEARQRLLIEGDMLALIVGDNAARAGAIERVLAEHDMATGALKVAASELAALEDPYERLTRLNEVRESTVAGRIEALRQQTQTRSASLKMLRPPPPAALRRWLRCEAAAAPDPQRLQIDLGPAGLERIAAAPLRAWGDIRSAFGEEAVAAYIAEPEWKRSPLGELARLRLLSADAAPDALREAVTKVVERFKDEGEALVEMVNQLSRQADRDAEWRGQDEVFRSVAMWAWADILWRTLASVRFDPVEVAKFWKKASPERPRDLVTNARAMAAMAPPSISAARVLACGLAQALGDRRQEGWTEADGMALGRMALDAARAGKPLGPLVQVPDCALTWLAEASPFIWREDGATPEASTAEAVAQYPEDQTKLASIAIGGADTLDEATADILMAKLEVDPERFAAADNWIADLRFTALAISALHRRGGLDEARAERAFGLFGRMVASLRTRADWATVREAVYQFIFASAAVLSAESAAKVLAALFETAPTPERKLLQRVAEIFLAALPFEERTPFWREHLRMRSIL